jgi:signal transduction histidine kinase
MLAHAKRRIRERIYERLAQRARIARDLHDTFFQGIQGLLLRFNATKFGLPNDDPTRRILGETLQLSDQVMLEGRELLLDLRTTASEPGDLPAALAECGQRMQKDHGCELSWLLRQSSRVEPRCLRGNVESRQGGARKVASLQHYLCELLLANQLLRLALMKITARPAGDGDAVQS